MRAFAVCAIVLFIAACTGAPGPTLSAGPTPTSTPVSSSGASPSSHASASPGRQPTPAPALVPAIGDYVFEEFDVRAGTHPHDVSPHPDGSVWYTGQANGTAGRLDPATGEATEI